MEGYEGSMYGEDNTLTQEVSSTPDSVLQSPVC